MKRLTCCALIALALLLSGCSLMGGASFVSGTGETVRAERQFLRWLETTNVERKRLGLDTLDTCSEIYRYDSEWANFVPDCKDRVKRYQHGDSTALWWPQ